MDINGAGAIISGGASGLGEATSRTLAAAGATVTIADLNADKGKALADEIGGQFVQTDVSDEASVAAAVDAAAATGVPLRIAVSCAGIGWASRVIGRDGSP
ncbi:MAG: SDR family NAD(P)-dependent oxidoreductase, partial [Acidimicrobiales bacterium]